MEVLTLACLRGCYLLMTDPCACLLTVVSVYLVCIFSISVRLGAYSSNTVALQYA